MARVVPGADLKSRTRGLEALIRTWADGQVYELILGEDMPGQKDLVSIRGTIGSWASRNGYSLRSTTRLLPEGHIRIQLIKK